MKVADLKKWLENDDFLPTSYSLPGDPRTGGYTLETNGPRWIVYWLDPDRGGRTDLYDGASEDAACDCLWHEINRDKGARMPNLAELEHQLYWIECPQDMYSLDGIPCANATTLVCDDDGKWHVFLWNGQTREDEAIFERERRACQEMWNRLAAKMHTWGR